MDEAQPQQISNSSALDFSEKPIGEAATPMEVGTESSKDAIAPHTAPDELTEYFNGDTKLALFFASWLSKGLNASRAYQALHPEVTQASARVLGCRMLTRVNMKAILEANGLDIEKYLNQLLEGLTAYRWDPIASDNVPDHKTRRIYHQVLGQLLGIEKSLERTSDGGYNAINQQNNRYFYSSPSELAADIRKEAERREANRQKQSEATDSSSQS